MHLDLLDTLYQTSNLTLLNKPSQTHSFKHALSDTNFNTCTLTLSPSSHNLTLTLALLLHSFALATVSSFTPGTVYLYCFLLSFVIDS
ncbi:hypothetical protein BDQ17DRAFT_1429305 [Cyathus striatus]|nr:hypothetical protein BDQ17DRAFT_1429305 [Cyathus striatus]